MEIPKGKFSEENYRTVRDAIGDLQKVQTVTEVKDDIGTPLESVDDISELGRSLREVPLILWLCRRSFIRL